MSTATPLPPLPKQPLGRTFVVSVVVLGMVALTQLTAVGLYYLPVIAQQLRNSTAPAPAIPSRPTPAPILKTEPIQPATVQKPALAPSDFQKVQRLVMDAERNIRIGEFDTALKLLNQADNLLPGDPKILVSKALVLERLDQPAEAALALDAALDSPDLPPAARPEIQKKLDQLSSLVATDPSGKTVAGLESSPDTDVRDSYGLQPGVSLGIVLARIKDVEVGIKKLQVAVKSRPEAKIDVKDVKIQVYFYEQTDDGEIVLTESRVPWQWLSQPIDWSANEPELVEMQYNLPPSEANAGSPGRKYFGYVVGIYYKGELQDFRSDPAKLAKEFPLPLDLKQTAE